MANGYLTVTFVFENLLTRKGNSINQLYESLCYWSISMNQSKRKKNIPDINSCCLGEEDFRNITVGESLLWTLGFALCLQAWLLIAALGLQIPALLLAWRMDTIEFYCRFYFFAWRKVHTRGLWFLQTFQFFSKSVKRLKKKNNKHKQMQNSQIFCIFLKQYFSSFVFC